jgi:hypothetical protein
MLKIMDTKIDKIMSAMLLGSRTRTGEIPYALDNLFYENFGMSYDEVLKNYGDSIDILS